MATITFQDVSALLNETKTRPRTHIREHSNNDVHDPWEVSTVDQLITLMSTQPQKCFDMLKTLRNERDMFRDIAEGFIVVYQKAKRYRLERDVAKRSSDQSKSEPKSESKPALLPELLSVATSSAVTPSHKTDKSSKLPDPELFMGSGRPSWEVWESNMFMKLIGNADHYPTEQLRISYIASRLGGVPADRALARFNPRSLNPYKTAQDVFDHLSSIYGGSHRFVTAEAKFQTLRQGATLDH